MTKREAYRIIDMVLENPDGLLAREFNIDMDGLYSLFKKEDLTDGIRILHRTMNIKDIDDRKLLALLAKECLRLDYFDTLQVKEYARFIKLR